MDKVYIGKIVSTHGIKGEIKIISDFEYKKNVFKPGKNLIIDNEDYTIRTYRHHKNYEMITLNNYYNINDILFLMKKKVYINKDELCLSEKEVLDSELLKYRVIVNNEIEGFIEDVFFASITNKIIKVNINKKSILVPFNSPMVKKISKKENIIYLELLEGMIWWR